MHHIYIRINAKKDQEQGVVGNSVPPDKMTNVLDEVMDYKPTSKVPDMNDHVFNNDSDDDDDVDNQRHNVHVEVLVQAVKPCLLDL